MALSPSAGFLLGIFVSFGLRVFTLGMARDNAKRQNSEGGVSSLKGCSAIDLGQQIAERV